jgi:isoamylase
MGDEVRRTQRGNNNAYCQDNDLSWFDWTLLDRHGDILRFVRRLIRFVLSLEVTRRDPAMTLSALLRQSQITWHGVKLGLPDWSDESRALAFSAIGLKNVLCLHIMFNAHREALEFELPRSQDGQWGPWQRVVDTCREPPEDFCDWPAGPPVEGPAYNVGSRSVVILSARARAGNR